MIYLKYKKFLTFFLIGFFLLIILLEITCRYGYQFFFPKHWVYKIQEKQIHCYDTLIKVIRLCPNVNQTLNHPLGYSFNIQTDQSGWRFVPRIHDGELFIENTVSKENNNIWILGDSLSMGFGIDGDKTFGFQLAQLGYKVRVLASDSMGSWDIYKILSTEYKMVQNKNPNSLPNVVFWIFSRSDFLDDTNPSSYWKFQLGKIFCLANIIRAEKERIRIARERNDYIELLSEDFHPPMDNHPTLLAIRSIFEFCKNNNILPVILMVPDWNPRLNRIEFGTDYFLFMKDFFKKLGFIVIDISNSYKKHGGLLWLENDGHPNERAHSIFYQETKKFLESLANK